MQFSLLTLRKGFNECILIFLCYHLILGNRSDIKTETVPVHRTSDIKRQGYHKRVSYNHSIGSWDMISSSYIDRTCTLKFITCYTLTVEMIICDSFSSKSNDTIVFNYKHTNRYD
jgi:hypothetical protein